MALGGHSIRADQCPLSGLQQTLDDCRRTASRNYAPLPAPHILATRSGQRRGGKRGIPDPTSYRRRGRGYRRGQRHRRSVLPATGRGGGDGRRDPPAPVVTRNAKGVSITRRQNDAGDGAIANETERVRHTTRGNGCRLAPCHPGAGAWTNLSPR